MTSLTLESSLLKAIYAGITSKAVEADAASLNILEAHVLVRQVNQNKSGMFFLMSEPIEWEGENTIFTLSKDDLKTISRLTDGPITIDLEEGKATCKVGKVKKTVPLQSESKFTEMNPRPEMDAKFSVTDQLIDSLKTAFSDVTQGAVNVKASADKIVVSIKDSTTVRSTEVEIPKEDCTVWEIKQDTVAAFDRDLFNAMLDNKMKGTEATIEFGENKPLFLMQSTNDFRCKILLAPVIDD